MDPQYLLLPLFSSSHGSAFPSPTLSREGHNQGLLLLLLPSPSVFAGERAWAISGVLVLLCFLTLFNVAPQSFLGTGGLRPLQALAGATGDRRGALAGGCDYSDGRWVWDDGLPRTAYSEGCRFLDPGFRCQRNGRGDADYVKWRWQPHACDLPRFNTSDMLERSRNSRIVFAGDSIGRNHWESLVCLLATAAGNQSSIYERNGNPITKHKGYLSIRFDAHNLTVEYYRAPFLMLVDRPPAGSPSHVKKVVRVDKLHWRSEQWVGADIFVFNTGHWWNQDKTEKMGCYFQEADHVNETMDVRKAFRRSLQTWKEWVLQNVHPHESYVFFRSYSPVHFSGGTWEEGGRCDQNTAPDANHMDTVAEAWSNEDVSETIEDLRGENRNVQFLNITYLTSFRSDGHPSVHREPGTRIPFPQDCSHWCLPGVPDTWNELLYSYLSQTGKRTPA